ncbi:MAG: NusA antitermination factor [Candidatus Beckwithbacteria bacterium GW2011_GWA2_43_10]|uniref:Transcription termination/antitermination protein NusA n=1 Tax=Candidatus Beckwithbacteria bacterium GW2011_GWA2_43_10 TaxID=1618369 RepID=A0A0G1EA51_9BACT|nr:MAG: NusA antitermination factor [Candidatus Beckwithbacteria bacterium GW2011_GWA2_43_10]
MDITNLPKSARTEFTSALNQICAERGISPQAVIATIKTALIAAYKKDFGLTEESEDISYEAELDEIVGSAKIFELDKKGQKKDITPPGFGRIAAQTAKQVILQQIREAEKDAIITEYQDKIKTLVNGMVLRFDGEFIICDIGRGQGLMPPEEQAGGEHYHLNQRLTLYIKDIQDTVKGKQIIISRADPQLVVELFKREVPEVNSSAVEIKIIAREAGSRSKVAVTSSQAGVDPVGSCVGQKGVRVQAVINELGGEKLDIIEYSDDVEKFIISSLQPADNLKVKLDEKNKTAVITVPEDQLSLAIGRDGQNVRLAAKLTGYKLNLNPPKAKKVKKAKTKDDQINKKVKKAKKAKV